METTATDTKHTQGQWKSDGDYVKGPAGEMIAACRITTREGFAHSAEEDRANAEFIARACNTHDKLLEACKAAKMHLQPDLVEPGRTVFWKLVAAIAKATAE